MSRNKETAEFMKVLLELQQAGTGHVMFVEGEAGIGKTQVCGPAFSLSDGGYAVDSQLLSHRRD